MVVLIFTTKTYYHFFVFWGLIHMSLRSEQSLTISRDSLNEDISSLAHTFIRLQSSICLYTLVITHYRRDLEWCSFRTRGQAVVAYTPSDGVTQFPTSAACYLSFIAVSDSDLLLSPQFSHYPGTGR